MILTTRTGDRIAVTVVEIDRGKIRLGFTADESVKIMREELMPPNRRLESLRTAS